MPPLFLGCYWSDPFFLNEVWHWHIGLRWAIVALWATCLSHLWHCFRHIMMVWYALWVVVWNVMQIQEHVCMLWHFILSLMSCSMAKPTKWHVRPAKTQISLGIRPVWSESSLSAWRNIGSSATHWAHSKDADQTGRMPRLIWVFAGRTVILLVLSCCSSFHLFILFLQDVKDEGGRNVTFTEDASLTINNLKAGYTYTFYVSKLMSNQGIYNHCDNTNH